MTRISITGLALLVLAIAFGLAALRAPSPIGASLMFLIVLFSLLSGILLAITQGGTVRAFWTGFVLFGGPVFLAAFGSWPFANTNNLLLPTREGAQLFVTFNPRPGPPYEDVRVFNPAQLNHVVLDGFAHWKSLLPFFRSILLSLSTLLLAFLGGLLASILWTPRDEPA